MFKLSVVKANDEKYLVNYYRKYEDVKISSFEKVIAQLEVYRNFLPSIFKEEPILRELSKEEKTEILNFRKNVLEEGLVKN